MKAAVTHPWLRRVSDYHSGGVSAAERAAVEAHLAECDECQQALATYRRFYALARSPLRLSDGAAGALAGYRPVIQEETMITNDSNRETGTASIRPRRPRAALTTLGSIAAVLLVALLAGAIFALHGGLLHPAGPRPTSTPAIPTATATPTGPKVLFQNSLASPPSSDWSNDPSTGCFFAGGGFHVKGQVNCMLPNASFQVQTDTVTNADITVKVKQVGGPATGSYGIGLGNPLQWDRFDINSAGRWSFLYCQGARCTTIVGSTASAAIHAGLGMTNTLEVRVVNNHFDFFANGTKIGQADDSNYVLNISGQIALDGSNGIEVAFNDLKIATAS
jgi:hypothetical protein